MKIHRIIDAKVKQGPSLVGKSLWHILQPNFPFY